jgi:hypothetical protein
MIKNALGCAVELIDMYENGPVFYESLNASLIEQWVRY